jgi:hypothetical protein
MLTVIMLSVIMPSFILSSAIMLEIMAPPLPPGIGPIIIIALKKSLTYNLSIWGNHNWSAQPRPNV